MKIIEELITTGAPEVTPEALEYMIRHLPQLRAKFANLEEPPIDLIEPVDFLAQVLEDFNSGLCRNLTYHAVADITFALQYLYQEVDLIPDHLPEVGFADDAAVTNRVLTKHGSILREYALQRGFEWEKLLAL